mmetsp:Transcript_31622/g.73778  ORF Transcript_31622/g.73778 Transcript_31622/m.73778 type:complete len:287 (-) Transcript_31622:210-1070(-)
MEPPKAPSLWWKGRTGLDLVAMHPFHQHRRNSTRNALGAACRLGCVYIAVAWLAAPTLVFVGHQIQALGVATRHHSQVTLEARRPPSAYNLFIKQAWAEEDVQDAAAAEGISPMAYVAQLWKKADKPTKDKFKKLAEEAKADFVPDSPKKKRRPSGKEFFMKELKNDPEWMAKNRMNFLKEAGAEWKKLTREDKDYYKDLAEDEPDPVPKKPKKKRLTISGYQLFVREIMRDEEFKAAFSSAPEMMKAAAKAWREADDALKEDYKALAAEETARRKAEAAAADAEE